MNNYKKIDCTKEKYKDCINIQLSNRTPFREHYFGSRKTLIINDKARASLVRELESLSIGEISVNQFTSFIASFNRVLYNRILENQDLMNLEIKFNGLSRKKNKEQFANIKNGGLFYNIDLKNAYWQFAHKLSYITDNFYNKYKDLDEYKKAKRYCVSFLARGNKMVYNSNGVEFEIVCNTSCLNRVYKNIRHSLYNSILEISKEVDFIEYNIDGISILDKDVSKVMEYFKNKELEFKITRCQKLNDAMYMYGSKLRSFTKNNIKYEQGK